LAFNDFACFKNLAAFSMEFSFFEPPFMDAWSCPSFTYLDSSSMGLFVLDFTDVEVTIAEI